MDEQKTKRSRGKSKIKTIAQRPRTEGKTEGWGGGRGRKMGIKFLKR